MNLFKINKYCYKQISLFLLFDYMKSSQNTTVKSDRKDSTKYLNITPTRILENQIPLYSIYNEIPALKVLDYYNYKHLDILYAKVKEANEIYIFNQASKKQFKKLYNVIKILKQELKSHSIQYKKKLTVTSNEITNKIEISKNLNSVVTIYPNKLKELLIDYKDILNGINLKYDDFLKINDELKKSLQELVRIYKGSIKFSDETNEEFEIRYTKTMGFSKFKLYSQKLKKIQQNLHRNTKVIDDIIKYVDKYKRTLLFEIEPIENPPLKKKVKIETM